MMVYTRLTTPEERALIRFLYNEKTLSLRQISRKTGRSPATVLRVIRDAKGKETRYSNNQDSAGLRRGRPARLTDREQRLIIRTLHKLWRTEGNFTARRLMKEANLSENHVSVRTIRRFLNSKGFFYLQARKKGLLTDSDRTKRIAFANKMLNEHGKNFWTNEVAFYLDGVGFAHKTNPMDQARAPTGRIYRKKSEGLDQYCTAKGSKVGTGGKVVKFLVAISYNVGVILCKEYSEMNGNIFAKFIEENFEEMFVKSRKPNTRKFTQDNCPIQNSRVARCAWTRLNAELVKLPSKSPDIHIIENVFNIVREDLRSEVLQKQIERETFAQFKERVRNLILRVPVVKINNLILSMESRLKEVIERKGQRLKY